MSNIKTILIALVVVAYCVFRLISDAIHANISNTQLKNTVNQHEASVSAIMSKFKEANDGAVKTRDTFEKQAASMKERLNDYEASTADMAEKLKKANEDVLKYRESVARQIAANEKIKIAVESAKTEAQKAIMEARQTAEASVNEGALKVREEFIGQMASMKAQLNNATVQYEASAADMANKLKEAGDDALTARGELVRQTRKADEDLSRVREELTGQIDSLKVQLNRQEASFMDMENKLKQANDDAAKYREAFTRQTKKDSEEALNVREELSGQIAILKNQISNNEASTADMANKLKKANEDVVKYREALDKQIALMKTQPSNKPPQYDASIADMANKLKRANEDMAKYRQALDEQSAVNERVRAESNEVKSEAEKALSKAKAMPVSNDLAKVREDLTSQITLLKTHLEKSKAYSADMTNKIKKANEDAAKAREALARQIVFSEKAKAETDAAKAETEKVISAARSAPPPPTNDDAMKVRKELAAQIDSLKTQLNNTALQYDTYSAEMTKKFNRATEDALRARGELARQTKQASDDSIKTREEFTGQIALLKTQLRKYEASAVEMADKLKRSNDELLQHRMALDRQTVLSENIRAEGAAVKSEADKAAGIAKVEADKAVSQARREAIALVNDSTMKAREELTVEITSLKTQLRKSEAFAAEAAAKLKQADDDAIKSRSAFEMQVASMKSQLKNIAVQYEAAAVEMTAKLKKANDDAARAREALTKQIVLNEKAKAAGEAVKIDIIKGIGEVKQAAAAKVMADKARADADALLGQIGAAPDYRR